MHAHLRGILLTIDDDLAGNVISFLKETEMFQSQYFCEEEWKYYGK